MQIPTSLDLLNNWSLRDKGKLIETSSLRRFEFELYFWKMVTKKFFVIFVNKIELFEFVFMKTQFDASRRGDFDELSQSF